MIDDVEIDVLRQEVLADAFGDVRVDLVLVEDAGLLVLLEDRPVGVDAPHFDLWIALLEKPSDSGNRSARADAHDEVRDAAVGLIPDFRRRLLVMRPGVRQVVVLIRFPGIRNLLLQP